MGVRVESALGFAGGVRAGRIRLDVAGNPVPHSRFEPLREASIGRESLDRGAECRDRAVIGRQLRPGQCRKESDRGVAPTGVAQVLKHANVRLQKLPPLFFQAAATEQCGDRLSRSVDHDDGLQASRVLHQAFQRLLSALDPDERRVEVLLFEVARPEFQ